MEASGIRLDSSSVQSRAYVCAVSLSSRARKRRKGKEESDEPGSTSKTISRASFQNGTIVWRPGDLKKGICQSAPRERTICDIVVFQRGSSFFSRERCGRNRGEGREGERGGGGRTRGLLN